MFQFSVQCSNFLYNVLIFFGIFQFSVQCYNFLCNVPIFCTMFQFSLQCSNFLHNVTIFLYNVPIFCTMFQFFLAMFLCFKILSKFQSVQKISQPKYLYFGLKAKVAIMEQKRGEVDIFCNEKNVKSSFQPEGRKVSLGSSLPGHF